MTRMTPKPEQEQAIQRMLNEPTRRALAGSELGTGKTLVACELGIRLGLATNLVVAPLHTFDGWERTLGLQTNGQQEFRKIDSKKDGKAALLDLFLGKPGWYFVGREYARTLSWSKYKLGYVVWDESHVMQSERSASFKAAKTLRHAEYLHFMSATWFGSQFSGAWSTPAVLWPEWMKENGWLLNNGKGFWSWAEDFAVIENDYFAGKVVKREKNPGAWVRSLPCYVALESKMDEPLFQEIRVPLTPAQEKQYKQMSESALVWLNENPLVAELPLTKAIRLQQIALGTIDVDVDEAGTETVHFPEDSKSNKFDALKSFLSDIPNEKVVIATASAKYARLVAARLGDKAFAWTGDASQQERAEAKERFINGDLQYIVATQPSAAEGLDGFQFASHIMVRLRKSDQVVLENQFLGRLQRHGQTKRVLVYDFISEGTLEDKRGESLLARELEMRGSLDKVR